MKKTAIFALLSFIPLMITAQTQILLSTGSKSMTATLVDNDATQALISMISNGPVTVKMEDYGGFEKVGELPYPLPTSNSQITTNPGDIMLYQGNSIVIFYESNSWSYTPLGKIDGATAANLREFLGKGNLSLTILLTPNAGINNIQADKLEENEVYDLAGRKISSHPTKPGIYLINGKKHLIK